MIEIKKILLPVDFSEASTVLLPYAMEFAEKYGALLFILFVAEDPFTYSGVPDTEDLFPIEYSEEIVSRARKRMATFVEDNFDESSRDVEGVVLVGHPAEAIINYANQEKMDLLIIGTHGFKGFDKLVFGSVADKVIKMAPCPVLTINTHQRA